ncbi:MAG: glycosyltransferase [Caldilineaceae bacterium]
MKVVMVSKALVTAAYRRKAAEIAALGVDLTVIVPPSWRDSRGVQRVGQQIAQEYKLTVAPVLLNGHFHLHFYPTLARRLAQIQPDLLHMDEEPYNLATWLALRAAHRLGIPSLFFCWQNIQRQYPPPFRWMEQNSYQWARHAIAGNVEAATVLQRKGYRGPLSIIPQFGVDPALFQPAPHASACEADSPNPLRIGYAGGLVAEKGIDILLQACALLKGAWNLHIVGSGAQESALRELAATLGIIDKVQFEARRSSLAMPPFYQGLDLFVLPSRTMPNWKEQFGRVLIEAMACGVAVVGSDSGEIPNVIGDAGCIFPEGNAHALHACLQELLDAPTKRCALAQAGRRRVLAHFTMQQVAQKTVQVYQQMMDSQS